MRGSRSSVVILVLVLLAAGCGWTQQGGNSARTSAVIDPDFPVTSGPSYDLAWDDFPCVCDQPLAVGGVVYRAGGYYGSDYDTIDVAAADAATGATKWSRSFGGYYNGTQLLAVGNGLAYVVYSYTTSLDDDGQRINQLIALDASTGATRWTKDMPNGVGALLLDGAGLFVASGNQITRFGTDGSVGWSVTTPGAFGDFVADPGRRLLVASKVNGAPSVSYVTAYDLATGAASPVTQSSTITFASLRVANDLLYFSNCAVPGCAASTLRLDTAASGWSASGEKLLSVTSTRALLVAPGTGGGATDLVARNPTTGALIWRVTHLGVGDALVAGQLLFVTSSTTAAGNGGIDVRDPEDGHLLTTLEDHGYLLAAADGRLISSDFGFSFQVWAPPSSDAVRRASRSGHDQVGGSDLLPAAERLPRLETSR